MKKFALYIITACFFVIACARQKPVIQIADDDWEATPFAYEGCRNGSYASAPGEAPYVAQTNEFVCATGIRMPGHSECKRFVVWGGEEGKKYDCVTNFTFADGRPLYVAGIGKEWGALPCGDTNTYCSRYSVVWGKKEEKRYDKILPPEFPHDDRLKIFRGKPLYRAMENGKWFAVWGKEEGMRYDDVFDLTIWKGEPLYGATVSRRDLKKDAVIHGGRELKAYDRIKRVMPAGNKPLIIAERGAGTGEFVVHGDKEGKTYEEVGRFCHSFFSPGGFCGLEDFDFAGGKPLYKAREGNGWLVVWGEKEGKRYSYVSHLALAGGKPLYAVREFTGYDSVFAPGLLGKNGRYPPSSVFVRKDGRIVWIYDRGYKEITDGEYKWLVVWGESEGRRYDAVEDLAFVNDKPLYKVRESGSRFVVWGEEELRQYDDFACRGGRLAFHYSGNPASAD